MSVERRVITAPVTVERRAEGQPSVVRGYAALYGTEAVIGGLFRERVAPGAFRAVIGADCDVRALYNHDDNIVLARTKAGTLSLFEDERGLGYEFTPNPMDSDAMNVVARIQRGDVSQSSYGFQIAKDGDTWERPTRAGELPLRTITKFAALRDVSPVTYPAFEETTVEARSAAAAMSSQVEPDVRAAAQATVSAAEETGEAIQFAELKSLLAQLATLAADAGPVVDALIAENGPADDSPEAEAAEESVESARYAVLQSKAAQLCGAACAFASLVSSLKWGGYGYYSAAQLATLRAEVDAIDVEV